jgi:single-strand DNA-binding protein
MSYVSVAGNLTKDGETKFLADGTELLAFSVADNMGWGEKKHTVFYNCSVFGKRASSLAPYLKKGQAVTVFGELDRRDWESDGGKSGVSLDIRVSDVKLQGGKRQETTAQPQTTAQPDAPSFKDDDIPF